MGRSAETLMKVALTRAKTAGKHWAAAKSGDGGHHYANARYGYEMAMNALKSAARASRKQVKSR